jgi:hypothetical protein
MMGERLVGRLVGERLVELRDRMMKLGRRHGIAGEACRLH